MIRLVVALQIAAAVPTEGAPGVLSIRASGATADVTVVQRDGVSSVPVARLAPVIAVKDSATAGGRHHVRIGDSWVTLADGVPFAITGGEVVPLAVPPRERDGVLLVPYEVFAELLPRLNPQRWRYDATRRELTLYAVGEGPRAVITATSGTPARHPAPARPGGRGRHRVVVVDAGHGGVDYGMRGPIGTHWQIHEKDITLAVAKKLAAALRDRGVDVLMTRTTDTLIGLYDRGPMANKAHGDVFVSVHVNAAPLQWKKPGDTRGYETYFLSEAKTEDARRVERMENEAVRFETGANAPTGDPLNYIITDMAQNEHLRESEDLAETVQQRLGDVLPGPSRGVMQAGFVVLKTAYMPSVLVEMGFGTNVDDARFLNSGSQQRRIASTLADAVIQYLVRYEKRLKAAAP